jgi:protein-S-isoprenylcysteine O-methyltransferase Ste14
MAIRDEYERSGLWLFRWRSFIPLLIIPLALFALRHYGVMEKLIGERIEDIFEGISIAISFLGLLVRCIIVGTAPKGTSGRNTKRQRADVLNTTGMYSIVRHPLYLGNFLIFLGIALFTQSFWFALTGIMVYWLYYERIIFAEEAFLRQKFGREFEEWAKTTPLIVPDIRKWKKPLLGFSLKSVLRREYTGFFGIVASFSLLKLIGGYFEHGKFEFRIEWWIFFLAGLFIYIALRSLKKYS